MPDWGSYRTLGGGAYRASIDRGSDGMYGEAEGA
jgi:hypothetical protein